MRLTTIAVESTFLAFLIGIVLLLPSAFFVVNESMIVARQSQQIRSSQDFKANSERIEQIREATAKVNIFKGINDVGTYRQVLKPLVDYTETINTNISISEIVYEETKEDVNISLKGSAATRRDLTAFIQALQQDVRFTSVQSPISNLVENTNVPFSIALQSTTKLLYELE